MPKLLFWIGQNLIHFGLAKHMQDQLDSEYYAVIDCTNKPKEFFKTQKIVNFKKIWFYHDQFSNQDSTPDLDYLKEFEQKYDVTLSKFFHNERIFMEFNEFYNFSENEILTIIENECKFFEKIFDNDPDFVLMFTPFFHHEALFVHLCNFKKIPVLDLFQSRLPSRTVISLKNKLQSFNSYNNDNLHNSFLDIREYIQSFSVKDKFGFQSKKFQSSKKALLKAGIDFLTNSNYTLPETHYTYFGRTKSKVLQNFLSNSIKIKQRKKFIDKNSINKTEDENFVLYPLQLDSESSLLINAPFHLNQTQIIKNIAKSLPIDFKLYVKEHPSSVLRGWRSIETYKEILSIPNVKFVHPHATFEPIIQKSSLVVTINSTVALDALLWGVPSMVLASSSLDYQDWGYSVIPEIEKIQNFESLPSLISKCINKKIKPEKISNFIHFQKHISFPSKLDTLIEEIDKKFHHNGFLTDVSISENIMNEFLDENKDLFSELVDEHIKEIKN